MLIHTDRIFAEKINEYMENNNFSKEDFAQKCGIDCKILDKIYEKDEEIELETLLDIAKVMGISIEFLLSNV